MGAGLARCKSVDALAHGAKRTAETSLRKYFVSLILKLIKSKLRAVERMSKTAEKELTPACIIEQLHRITRPTDRDAETMIICQTVAKNKVFL